MEILTMASQLIFGLAILVLLHESGHYVAARAFGIKIEKFYLFFDAWGIKLFRFIKGETEYGIGWLPLGGYVKIAGMIDESMDKAQMKNPPQNWEFRSKPAWQRLIVMLSGITVNLILGIFIFGLLKYSYGDRYLPMSQVKYGIVAMDLARQAGLKTGDKIISVNGKEIQRFSELISPELFIEKNAVIRVEREDKILDVRLPRDILKKLSSSKEKIFVEQRMTFFVQDVVPNSNAAKAGLMKDDRITAVNGHSIQFFDQCRAMLENSKGQEIGLTVHRKGNEVELPARVDDSGKLGFYPGTHDFQYAVNHYGLKESFIVGGSEAIGWLMLNIRGFGKIIRGEVSASESLSGPIGIAAVYGGVWNWHKFWFITGILSMILGFVNVLPIPALDGGHALFLCVEAVTGKKFSDKFMEKVQIAGMIILAALMTFVIGNDIWKYILN